MLNTRILFCSALMASASSFANIPIESRGLSQPTTASTPIAANVGADQISTNMNWQIIQKNQQLEADLRSLRGKIEELENANEQLNHELNNRYTDLDQRLELLQQKLDAENSQESAESTEDNQQDTAPSTITPNTADIVPTPTQVTQPLSNKNDNALDLAAYTIALEAFQQGGTSQSIAPMRNFIKNHPQSLYLSDAYFWMGEFYLGSQPVNYKRAQANYTEVVNQHPQSAKAPTALYRLYTLAKDIDKNLVLAHEYSTMLRTSYPHAKEIELIN
jgi:TolA-binding protein